MNLAQQIATAISALPRSRALSDERLAHWQTLLAQPTLIGQVHAQTPSVPLAELQRLQAVLAGEVAIAAHPSIAAVLRRAMADLKGLPVAINATWAGAAAAAPEALGRPRNNACWAIRQFAEQAFTEITGNPPVRISVHRNGRQTETGPFNQFLQRLFDAHGLDCRAESYGANQGRRAGKNRQ